jgi:hypothetical protein
MAQHLPDLRKRPARPQHLARDRMSKLMRADRPEPGSFAGIAHDLADPAAAERSLRGPDPAEHATAHRTRRPPVLQVGDDRVPNLSR